MEWEENPALSRLEYVRGEGRHKHRWKHDYAGFVTSENRRIGKCHRSITEAVARSLLRSGLVEERSPYDDEEVLPYPDQVFSIYRGVPYVAVPTEPGRSYHGYPWRGRISASMREALRVRAREEGTEDTFQRWLKRYELR